jgi:hypothetical protein
MLVVGCRGIPHDDGGGVRPLDADRVVVQHEILDAAGLAGLGTVAVEQLERAAAASAPEPGGIDVVQQVVSYEDARGLPAPMQVVRARDVEGARSVAHDVLPERHVLDSSPWAACVLVAHGDDEGDPFL